MSLRTIVLSLTCCATVFTTVLLPETSCGDEPMVFAHYMPWFRAEKEADGYINWDHWQWFGKGPKHDPDDIDENGRRDIASVFYPLIGPYDGRDPAVLEYHFLTAKLAGIEGFITDWYGPGTYSDEVFAAMVSTAERYDMKVAICLEEKAFFPGYSSATTREEVFDVAVSHIRHVLDTHGKSSAYLRRGGDPVFFIFNNHQSGSLGSHILTHEEVQTVLSRIEDQNVLLVRGYLDMHYAGIARGAYLWCDSREARENFYTHVPEAREKGVEYVVGTASPGFDDTGVWGWGNGTRVTDRRGTKEYEENWREVLKYKPDAIQIATWNDFQEGTTIEPSVEYEFEFIDLTERFVSAFTGRKSDLRDNRWPHRIYLMRKHLASARDEAAREKWSGKLDRLVDGLGPGATLLTRIKLWYVEKKIGSLVVSGRND